MQRDRVLQITKCALEARRQFLNADSSASICPYVLADAMGLDLRFLKIPSFEGMYVQTDNMILISAERPEGRKRFTCAHEIGHYILGHGTVIDEIVNNGANKQQEMEADCFAGMLLMPRSAVNFSIRRYGKQSADFNHLDIHILSNYFGVSYEGFLTQLRYNLNLLTKDQFSRLRNKDLKQIRKDILGTPTDCEVITIGDWWHGRAIELKVGDFIVSNGGFRIDGANLLDIEETEKGIIGKANKPGITRVVSDSGWCSFVKVSRKNYSGIFQYKYDEEVE